MTYMPKRTPITKFPSKRTSEWFYSEKGVCVRLVVPNRRLFTPGNSWRWWYLFTDTQAFVYIYIYNHVYPIQDTELSQTRSNVMKWISKYSFVFKKFSAYIDRSLLMLTNMELEEMLLVIRYYISVRTVLKQTLACYGQSAYRMVHGNNQCFLVKVNMDIFV